MLGSNELTLILLGYALGLTFTVIVFVMNRSQTQPPTVIVQQPAEDNNPAGCGSLIGIAVIILLVLILANFIMV